MIQFKAQGRILFVATILLAWLLVVAGRLAWLHLAEHTELVEVKVVEVHGGRVRPDLTDPSTLVEKNGALFEQDLSDGREGLAEVRLVEVASGRARPDLTDTSKLVGKDGALYERRLLLDRKKELRDSRRTWPATRGAIYDRNGMNNPAALSIPARFFFIDPRQVSDRHKTNLVELAGHIADVLGHPEFPADVILEDKLRQPSAYQPLRIFEEDDRFKAFANTTLFSGIYSRPDIIRLYPQGTRMAQVVGFVNRPDGVGGALRGAWGIEQRYEGHLAGINGSYEFQVDARRREIYDSRFNVIPPVHGASVHLTLDNNIQALLEDELRAARERTRAKRAWGIIQHVRTGEILAMASTPGFDPNQPAAIYHGEMAVWDNLPLCVNYEPGSTMKTFTVAAAIEEKIIDPETTRISVGQGAWFYEKHVLRDAVRDPPDGRGVDIATIVQKSSNIGTAKIALMLGDNSRSIKNGRHRMQESYLRLFGFGAKTGIELPAEEAGILRPCDRWDALSATRIGIGQGVAVTALQMVNAYSAIANGGYLMRPGLVKCVVADNGEVLHSFEPKVIGRPISPATAATLRKMLAGVATGGTARRARIEGYTVAGKTGTAQIPKKGGYNDNDYWASFVGFCPAENPVFAMLIVIEEPVKGMHTGGTAAAPVFAAVAEGTARYLKIPSDIVAEEIEYLPAMQIWPDADPMWRSVDD